MYSVSHDQLAYMLICVSMYKGWSNVKSLLCTGNIVIIMTHSIGHCGWVNAVGGVV